MDACLMTVGNLAAFIIGFGIAAMVVFIVGTFCDD